MAGWPSHTTEPRFPRLPSPPQAGRAGGRGSEPRAADLGQAPARAPNGRAEKKLPCGWLRNPQSAPKKPWNDASSLQVPTNHGFNHGFQGAKWISSMHSSLGSRPNLVFFSTWGCRSRGPTQCPQCFPFKPKGTVKNVTHAESLGVD